MCDCGFIIGEADFYLLRGIHLQDVTRLNDGKSDMRDGLVNWSKMKAIGKHCAIVIDCSRLAPHYPNNVDLSRLITRLPLFSLNDDDVREPDRLSRQ